MHYTSSLSRMATTKIGMRKILKKQLAPVDYIKWAVQSGVYKSIYIPEKNDNQNNQGRGRGPRGQQRPQGGGDQAHHYMPKINPYPEEYEILTLNPPLPMRPRLSKKDIRYLEEEQEMKDAMNAKKRNTPKTDALVQKYMKRYDARVKTTTTLTDAETEDNYYRDILEVSKPSSSPLNSKPSIEDMNTSMGRKPAVLSHAYEFALKQHEVLSNNENISEQESISMVEQLLAEEEQDERRQSRIRAQMVAEEMKMKTKDGSDQKDKNVTKGKAGVPPSKANTSELSTSTSTPPSSSIPSILYSKPRTIQAMQIWGKRLQAVPYNLWTLGASTALDHWIAVDVLGMKEESWNRLLSGELESDIQESRGEDVLVGDKARTVDIVNVRATLFPETVVHLMEEEEEEAMAIEEEFGNAEDLLTSSTDSEKEATERSIDELLASLGGFDDEEEDDEMADETTKPGSEAVAGDEDLDSRVAYMVDSLQDWRMKNDEKPFAEWDYHTKEEFNNWLTEYISLVTAESDGEVDLAATRDALLAEPPLTRETSESFWSQVQDEADAEILLHSLREKGAPTEDTSSDAAATTATASEKKSTEALEVFLNDVPYEQQLRQLVNLGTLRPILDEYYKESDRVKFMSQYGEMLLEGIELEHLVSDPNGHITMEDIGDDYFTRQDNVARNTKFSIKMIPFGTDEYGMSRSERARLLYRAWSMQKAGKAKYAESQFKKGKMPLKDRDV